MSGIDPAFGNWLAGLIDGEGCFRIHKGRANGRFPYYSCQFTLKLRDDDRPMLEEIAAVTGIGRIYRDRSRPGRSNPCALWRVDTKEQTRLLVALLDCFPLRSKKLRDYAIWREAVAHYAEQERGNRWHGARDWSAMADFKTRIEQGREYRGEVVPCPQG